MILFSNAVLIYLVDNVFLASDNFRVEHVVVWGSEKWPTTAFQCTHLTLYFVKLHLTPGCFL